MQNSDPTGPVRPVRIVSLIPSGTDLVAALGLADCLVGVSHECDHPAAAGLPVLTSSVIPPPTVDGPVLSAIEIDTIVSTSISQGESLYKTDRALLNQLAPDVVLSQDVCDVCAVNAETARFAMCDLPDGAQLVMLTATSVEGMYTDLRTVGEALGASEKANTLVSDMRASFENQLKRDHSKEKRVSVLALEWSDPPFLGGHWIPELVTLAGADHALSGPGEASRRSTWDEIADADPDVIVFCPCGYDLHQATLEATSLLALPAVASLRAIRSGRFFAVDANRLFSRCTTNLVEATELLRALTDLEPNQSVPYRANRIRI
jgi:iron complex transport system substrate-binding protein